VLLLHRTLRAAMSIRRYLDEMLAAGGGIAGHTASIAALDDTIAVAGGMLTVAGQIRSHTGTIATVLSERAGAAR
jgi:DNA-binding phage protein